ncbi:MAG: DUF2188 domain-containing protein [Planctomycetes bacterium]|nr:DUF2188 domain-containing protein [Planctomycetota bacterium]
MVFVSPTPQKQWRVKSTGSARADSVHDKKSDAVDRARDLSRNKKAELVVQNRNGQIGQKDSHGNDPKNIKG